MNDYVEGLAFSDLRVGTADAEGMEKEYKGATGKPDSTGKLFLRWLCGNLCMCLFFIINYDLVESIKDTLASCWSNFLHAGCPSFKPAL